MKTIVYIDGLTEPVNPGGITTYAFVVYREGKKVYEERKFVGSGKDFSNNVAEYSALYAALKWLIANGQTDEVEIRSDSKLLVNQMRGEWEARKGLYIQTYEKVKQLLSSFKNISFRWVPREENQEADRLSRLAYSEYIGKHKGQKLFSGNGWKQV
jgi:ribonuclease HI